MKNIFVLAGLWLFFIQQAARATDEPPPSWTIPAAGNGFARPTHPSSRLADRESFRTLTDSSEVLSIYFHVDRPSKLEIDLEAKTGEDQVPLLALVGDEPRKLTVSRKSISPQSLGQFDVREAGYLRVDLQRDASADGAALVEVKGLLVRSQTQGLQVTCVATNEGNMFYWGRRGPSVHLSYVLPQELDVEYGYSEITVAEGEEPIGSYFMANGFAEGYFGIQVNSPSERRVLFSIWSPFQTDDPRKIPADQQVRLLAKGPEVRAGEFGNEGSGGQSFLVYPWIAGRTYRFLSRVVPDGKGNTVYTSWFGDKEADEWRLIASFLRPKTDTYLRGFHSFLESFDPSTGDQMRRGQHGNIWVRDRDGTWHECLKARFSVDATGQGKHRLDFDGGALQSTFYLRNCGFFHGTQKPGMVFERSSSSSMPPGIDFSTLPRE
jgi:hypothetical protein